MSEPETIPDFMAEHVGVAVGRKYLTRDGVLFIDDGRVGLMHTGDEPVEERLIALAEVARVKVLDKPWHSLGTGMSMEIGDTRFTVEPNAIYQGTGFATPGKIRRAKDTVRAFESALDAAQRS